MKPFTFAEPASVQAALDLLASGHGGARLMAGGSDLLGELKEGTRHYPLLVSLGRIAALRKIESHAGGLRIGAGVTLAQLEHEPRLSGPYRILAEAARGVATPEIRNQGTLGGNLCQRPRCFHYRSRWIACLKKGGSACPAAASAHQQYLSVMGGQGCFAVPAADLAPPLLALDASAVVAGAAGESRVPLERFFTGPEVDVLRENVLLDTDVLAAVELPACPADWRGTYLKARERTAGDFPLVSVAFGCRLDGGSMRQVRMVLGGAAPVPWRCLEAQSLLEGRPYAPELAALAAQAAFAKAQPLPNNLFKVELGQALIARAIREVAGAG